MNLTNRAMFLVLAALFVSSGNSQSPDPFDSKDPFRRLDGGQRKSDPVEIDFTVRDQGGTPVAGAQIRGAGIRIPLRTDPKGKAKFSAERSFLSRWAANPKRTLRFSVTPPQQRQLAPASDTVRFEDLSKSNSVEIVLPPGTYLTGKLTGDRRAQSWTGVNLAIRSLEDANLRWTAFVRTNEQGEWKQTVPPGELRVTVDGLIPGCRSADKAKHPENYSRVVQIPEGLDRLELDDFKIEQLPELVVHVSDAEGNPIDQASVIVRYPDWLTPQSVLSVTASSTSRTAPNGSAQLLLEKTDWPHATVFATDAGTARRGRTVIDSVQADRVKITLISDIKLGGILTEKGAPAGQVELILYEMIEKPGGGWTSIRVADRASTDRKGRYLFDAEPGVHYAVTTARRDAQQRQPILHRTPLQPPVKNYRFPDYEIDQIEFP